MQLMVTYRAKYHQKNFCLPDAGDYFSSTACLNGGTCRDEVGFFECNCKPGFAGKWCEQSKTGF